MAEASVWQSPSGTTATLVVELAGPSPANLWNDENRNPWETQPAASNPPTPTADRVIWTDYVRPWLRWLEKSKFRAKGTRDSYEWHLTAVMERIGKPDLRDIAYRDIEDVLADLEAANGRWKPNTRNVYVASIRSFYTYVVDKEDLGDLGVKDLGRKLDPVPLEQVEREKTQHDPPTKDEVQAIVDRAEASGDTDFALELRFYWVSYGRILDVHSVTWSVLDLGPEPKVYYEKPSKHGNKLWRLLDQRTAKLLRARRVLKTPSGDDPVFARPGESSKAFGSRFDRHLKRRGAEAGIKKYLHTHLIRAAVQSYAGPAGIDDKFMDRQGGRVVRSSRDTYERYDPQVWRKWVEMLALD